jgi:predicted ribosomally synthesized peptide with nif11-like leader
MNPLPIDEFIQAVVYDHSIATGLKACESDQDIIDYAASKGFVFSSSEWQLHLALDRKTLSDAEMARILMVPVDHWSWAFRKVALWRAMLMDGV